jgi:hypothetical protein
VNVPRIRQSSIDCQQLKMRFFAVNDLHKMFEKETAGKVGRKKRGISCSHPRKPQQHKVPISEN